MDETLVGVYGTLRRGGHNHRLLAVDGARFVGADQIAGFTLYSNHAFPYALPSEGAHAGIVVEVYAVDQRVLASLDLLEGFSPERPNDSLYLRTSVTTAAGRDVMLYTPPRSAHAAIRAECHHIGGDWMAAVAV